MRKIMYLTFVALLAVMLPAAEPETFKLDFDAELWGTVGATEPGFESYVCVHETSASFTEQSYTAFGTTVSILPTWAAGAPAAAMQAINRRFFPEFPYEFTGAEINLVEDWIGTDTRETPSEPLTLTISGLPAGVYSWLSYHNDLENQTAVFQVTVNDASGSATVTGFNITNNAVTLDDVAKCELEISSNGADPITLDFDLTTGTFFVMNGFELTFERIRGAATDPVPEAGNSEVNSETTTAFSWSAPIDPNIVSVSGYDVIFGTDPNFLNMIDKVLYEDVTNPFVLADNGINLAYETTYHWRVDTHLVWDSNEITGVFNDIVAGQPWMFTTLSEDTPPVVTADDVLTAMEFMPATLTGTVNDHGEGDITTVTWELLGLLDPVDPNAMQVVNRTDAAFLANLAEIGITDPNLIMDWIGTDTRDGKVEGNPLILILKGLPTDTYSWTSYHHDAGDQNGMFDATVYDASVSSPATTTDIQITDANSTPVATFTTSIESNGSDDVILVFDLHPYGDPGSAAYWHESFFAMNGFELTGGSGSLNVDFGPVGAVPMTGYQAYAATHEVAASFTEQSYSAFGTTVSIQPVWGGYAMLEDTTTNLLSPTAAFETVWPNTYSVQLSAADGIAQTDSDTMTVTVGADACAAAQLDTSSWQGFSDFDLNEDCVVDIDDVAVLADEWLDDRNLTGQE